MIVVYKRFFARELYDTMLGHGIRPGRPVPGAGPRVEGTLERSGETVVTASPGGWRVLVDDKGEMVGEVPYRADCPNDDLWAIHEGINKDIQSLRDGVDVPADRVLMLLEVLAGISPKNLTATMVLKGLPSLFGDTCLYTDWLPRFRKAYASRERGADEIRADLQRTTKKMGQLLVEVERAGGGTMSPVEPPKPVDFAVAMERFKKKPAA